MWKIVKYRQKKKNRPVLVRSQTSDFHNMQEAVWMSTYALGMKYS
jgi:hypothetical protein